MDGLRHDKDFVYDIYQLDVHLVIEDFTLGSTRVIVTELVEEFILVTIMPVRKLTFCLWVPLVFFVFFVCTERNLELFVLVSDVSHGKSQKGIESSSGVGKLMMSTDPPNFALNASSQS